MFARRGEAAGEVELLLREERLVLNGSRRARLARAAVEEPGGEAPRRERALRAAALCRLAPLPHAPAAAFPSGTKQAPRPGESFARGSCVRCVVNRVGGMYVSTQGVGSIICSDGRRLPSPLLLVHHWRRHP